MAWAVALLILLLIIAALSIAGAGIFGAPWLPTPTGILERMFEEAELKPGETVVDLGCGDGRVLIAAARNRGARGIGIEIDPLKAAIARWRVRRAGLEGAVTIRTAHALGADLRQADVVFLFLSHQLIDRLKPKFEAELKPGARIVSYNFMVRGYPIWKVDAGKRWFIYRMDLGRKVDRRA